MGGFSSYPLAIVLASAVGVASLGAQTPPASQEAVPPATTRTGGSITMSGTRGPIISPGPRAFRALEMFVANSTGLLERFPEGGGALAAQVRDILLADKGQFDAVMALIPLATAAQQQSIGSGLGLTRLLYSFDAEFASLMQTRVVELNNRELLTGFAAFGGNPLGALGGGGGGNFSGPPAFVGPVGPVATGPANYAQGSGGTGGSGGEAPAAGGGVSRLSGGTTTTEASTTTGGSTPVN